MNKILTLCTVSGCILLLTSITSIAFEKNSKNKYDNIIYEFKLVLDDYLLNYCSTHDSYTVNRLYSKKKIINATIIREKIENFWVAPLCKRAERKAILKSSLLTDIFSVKTN